MEQHSGSTGTCTVCGLDTAVRVLGIKSSDFLTKPIGWFRQLSNEVIQDSRRIRADRVAEAKRLLSMPIQVCFQDPLMKLSGLYSRAKNHWVYGSVSLNYNSKGKWVFHCLDTDTVVTSFRAGVMHPQDVEKWLFRGTEVEPRPVIKADCVVCEGP